MTTTDRITPAVRRYHRAATSIADGTRAFAVELVGNAARHARNAYIDARDADDFNLMTYQMGACDALAVILATIGEDGVEGGRTAAKDIADHTAGAESHDLRTIGAHDAAANAIDSLSLFR